MAFRTQDLCKTTRRVKGGGRRRLFPRLIRDDKHMPRIGTAIRFFETKLGLRRRDLDAEALLHLFDDPKLARCLVGCLGRSYRYRTQRLAEVVGEQRAVALLGRGIAAPADLRAMAYARANESIGFVPAADRARFLADLTPELDPAEVEQALWLDAADQAVLMRVGPTPTKEEIRALYNLRVVETLLRVASTARFALRGDRAAVADVCARHGVEVQIRGDEATLFGQQDSVGLWARHGSRLARAALGLLGDGALGSGEATVQFGAEAFDVRLDTAFLREALPARGWSAPAETWEPLEALIAGLVAERRQGRLAGWRMRRWPEPIVGEEAVIWPEVGLSRGGESIGLLPLSADQLHAAAPALRALAARRPFIVLASGVEAEAVPGLTVLRLDREGTAAALVDHLERAGGADAGDPPPGWLTDLAAAARAAGSIAESELARRLDCAEEAVGGRLAPLAARVEDVVYIDGFGLCDDAFLSRVRAVLDDETRRNDGRLNLGALGRKLRALVGRNEGLHALIAHLSGELRPVA
jgi:predicted nuclease of restriction endonuclease-like RecB superfamily